MRLTSSGDYRLGMATSEDDARLKLFFGELARAGDTERLRAELSDA